MNALDESGQYEVYGFWKGYDDNSLNASRDTTSPSLLEGQEYHMLYPIQAQSTLGEPYYQMDALKEMPGVIDIDMMRLPPGRYAAAFLLKDIFGTRGRTPRRRYRTRSRYRARRRKRLFPPEEEAAEQCDAAQVSVSPQALRLAQTMAALADPGTTTDTISSGNTAKDMAASVEFQDPFNPSDNPVPVTTLQKLIQEKLALMDVLKGTVKVDLGRNTRYVGDIALKRVDFGKVENDFVLELASEESGDDGLSANGSTVLDGNLAIEGLTPVDHDGDAKWYWIGATPDAARDPDAALYLLAVDAATDEASLWRTTAGAVAGGPKGKPADFAEPQRMFAFRDHEADHDADSVRYDALMLDLDAAHEESTFEIMTDLPGSDELQRPAPAYVVLRPFTLEGADVPCYSIRDVLFAWLDASDGKVDLLNGQYTAANSDTTFDSPYTRIEGNGTEALQVIIKSGQPIWPEWLGDTVAGDIQGNYYELRDGSWVKVDADVVGLSA